MKHHLQNQLLRGNLTLNSQDHPIIYLQLFGRQKNVRKVFLLFFRQKRENPARTKANSIKKKILQEHSLVQMQIDIESLA